MSMPIRRISKKELAIIFGFYSPASGRTKTTRLRREVFTDLVLSELGMSEETYRARRIFLPAETNRIIDYFKIEPNEISAITASK